MITESTLNSIRQAVNIVELIGEYLPLKKSGQGFVGLCPFHGEKTPSFHVHPLKQCFHCFGCHKGGNIFTFIREVEGLNFPQAVEKLAKRAGIPMEETYRPRVHTPLDPKVAAVRERLLAALEWAAKYFNYLLTEVGEFESTRKYLASRKVSPATIKRFRLGVSPRGWSTLMDHMFKRGFTFEELVEAGLVVPKEGSPSRGYDRFRERLMFPIRDAEGQVLGFGARLLKDEPNQPKYLNSPESPLFSKRQTFYGIHENQRGIRLRQEAVLVEGYMDVVGLAEFGVNNAIATMGTAVTEEHCSQLRQITQKVVTVFDPDASGQEAWHRSVHLFLNAGIFAKDLFLPEGKDPDEFIQQEGADKFYEMCEKAPRQITKVLKEIAEEGALSEEERSKWLQEITPALIATRHTPDRALLWDDVSLVLKISIPALKEHIENAAQRAHRGPEPKRPQGSNQAQQANRGPVFIRAGRPTPSGIEALDLEFFRVCLTYPEHFAKLKADTRWLSLLHDATIRNWLEKLTSAKSEKDSSQTLESLVQSEPNSFLQSIAAGSLLAPKAEAAAPSSEPGSTPPSGKDLMEGLLKRLAQRKREEEIKALTAQVRLAERQGNSNEGIRLLEQLKQLRASPV